MARILHYVGAIVLTLALLIGCTPLDVIKTASGLAGDKPMVGIDTEVGDDDVAVGSDQAKTTGTNENEIEQNSGTVNLRQDTITRKETTSNKQQAETMSIETLSNTVSHGVAWYWVLIAGILIPFPTPRQIWRRLTTQQTTRMCHE